MSNRLNNGKLFWLIVGVPPLLLAGLIAFGLAGDYFAGVQVRAELTSMSNQGIAIDNRSLTEAIEARTSKQYSKAWQDVIVATLYVERQSWPFNMEVAEIDSVVPMNMPWKAEPIATEIAKLGLPIIKSLEQIPDAEKPIWRPLVMDGSNTWFHQVADHRSVARLLALEFRVAYHDGDTARALRAIELISRVLRFADADHLLVSELVQLAIEGQQDELIRGSLSADFWSDAQLSRLTQILNERKSLDQRWRESINDEQGLIFANLESMYPMTAALGLPARTLKLLLSLSRLLQELPSAGTDDHNLAVQQLMEDVSSGRGQWSAFSITSLRTANAAGLLTLAMPAYGSFAQTFARRQMYRNWTLCAIGIKQFQIRNNRFPTHLEELAQIGLTRDQWLAVNSRSSTGKPFGYQVSADQSTAILWTVPSSVVIGNDSAPTSVPPSELKEWQDKAADMEIRIR